MALTYDESANLMRDAAFIDRIKVACLHYADYIMGETPNTPAHSSRVRWAQTVIQSPEGVARQLAPSVTMDQAVQDAGLTEPSTETGGAVTSAISDEGLQSAVETTVNRLL